MRRPLSRGCALLLLVGCTPVQTRTEVVAVAASDVRYGAPAPGPEPPLAALEGRLEAPPSPYEVGLATWYGKAFAGHRTSNGERFDPAAMTAAHRRLPFGSWVEVRRPDTGARVVVRVTDRGPWGDARKIIDLSRAAAEVLGFTRDGVARVEIRIVAPPR